jgi:hypothetical protein
MLSLREQLDKQIVLNEQLLKDNTMKKVKSINIYGYISLLMLIPAFTGFCIVDYRFGLSFTFKVFAVITVVVIAYLEYWSSQRIKDSDFSTKSVKEIVSTLISMKKNNRKIRYMDIILSTIMVPWILYEIYANSFSKFIFKEGFPTYQFIGVNLTIFFSVLIAFILICNKYYNKNQQNINDMIEMLKEKE